MFSKSSNEGANKWNDQEPDQKRKFHSQVSKAQ